MNHWKESGSRQPRGDRHVLHRWKQGVETGGRLINVLKKKSGWIRKQRWTMREGGNVSII